MIIKAIYIVFIGVLTALLVGVGISAFYPSPKTPEELGAVRPYPAVMKEESTPAAQMRMKEEGQNQIEWRMYADAQKEYNLNVSIIATISAVVILVIGLVLSSKISLISDGFLLGSALTLLYSVGRSFSGGNSKVQFVIIAVGLIISLIVGYLKFVPTKTIS